MHVSSLKIWIEEWNSIIRNIIFKDQELLQLMEVPCGTKILDFIDRYFVKAGYTTRLLSDEKVRIVYSDTKEKDTDNPNVKRQLMTFDIYVKLEELHNYGIDRLMYRTELIADRLSRLLTSTEFCNQTGFRFRPAGSWDVGTKTIGYARYTVAFYYMKVI